MASGLSVTSIYNMVLDRLAEESVLGPADKKAVTRWLNRNYPIQRDALLQQHTWNFAIKRVKLTKDTEKPAFEWSYQYTLPADCVRVLPLTADGSRNGTPIGFVVEGLKLLTNSSSPLLVRYIRREDNPALYSPAFANVLAQILAANAAHWVTGKATFAKELTGSIAAMTNNAQTLDSLEGMPEEPYDDDVIRVR
jgi:hypothetical protein